MHTEGYILRRVCESAPHLLCNEVCLLLLICAAYELQAICCAFLHDPLPTEPDLLLRLR